MKEKIAKFISILTVVPIVAVFSVTLLYFNFREDFKSCGWYFYSIFFLTIMPLLAYPLKRILPGFKDKGRDGERKLAFVLAVSSYILGTTLVFILKAPIIVEKIFSAYIASGGMLAFINKIVKVKASGHACGVSGPITLLYHFLGVPALWLFLLLPIVFWARINLKRHSFKDLVTGTLVGILSTVIALGFF